MKARNEPSIHLQARLRCYYIPIARYNNSTTMNPALGEAMTQIVVTFTILGRVMFLVTIVEMHESLGCWVHDGRHLSTDGTGHEQVYANGGC